MIWYEVKQALAAVCVLAGAFLMLYVKDRNGGGILMVLGVAIAARARVDQLAEHLGVRL
jgi:hypothetical protein